ncbi:MAG: hypothetical protein VYC64_11695, partial [Candidatus Latescibacterota bacterium]|nr:hypothetical protein [Candidatus Latescibacterota bacterium]
MDDGGFPLRLIEHYNSRTGIWRARRTTGDLCGEAELQTGDRPFAELTWQLADDSADDVELTARLVERALRLVPRRFDSDPRLAALSKSLSNRQIPVRFFRQHHRILDIEIRDGKATLAVCADLAPALGVS